MVKVKSSPPKTVENFWDSPFLGFHTVLGQVNTCEVLLGAPLGQMVTSHCDISFWNAGEMT